MSSTSQAIDGGVLSQEGKYEGSNNIEEDTGVRYFQNFWATSLPPVFSFSPIWYAFLLLDPILAPKMVLICET